MVKTSLFNNLDKDAKTHLKENFIIALPLRKRLGEVLQDKIDAKYKAMRNKENYEKPSWALEQADGIGYVRALTDYKRLLNEE